MNLLSKTNKKIAGISNISIENFIFGKDETLKPKFTSILEIIFIEYFWIYIIFITIELLIG